MYAVVSVEGRSMESDAERARSDRILEFLTSKGLDGCPVCNGMEYGVGPVHSIIAEPNLDPAEGSLAVPVFCSNCGYMLFFSTRQLPNEGK